MREAKIARDLGFCRLGKPRQTRNERPRMPHLIHR